jgi:predicted Zn finger-like uncharacterized protein
MSLATRCAACGTVFRVVQDQLKVSEGWVRCGRCNEVFNALEGLFDLDREPAPGWTPSQRGALDALPGPAQAPGVAHEDAAARDAADAGHEPPDEAGASSSDSEIDTRVDSRVDSQPETRHAASGDDGADDDEDEWVAEAPAARTAADGAASDRADDGDVAPGDAAPAFLRQAERDARWQRPQVRVALALVAVLASLLLAGQVTLVHRDAVAAHWPQAAPLLTALCEPLDCRIEPLRRLEHLSVESSGLTQLDVASLYRLQVSLRSRGTLALMTPALDVTLTDSRGEVVARKVLAGSDFGGATPARLAPGGELTLTAVFDTGDRRVTGYDVEIFYP